MKKLLALLFLPLLLLSCKANFPVAQQSGKDDMAYLLFVSGKQYAGEKVQVSVDNAQPFTANVVKAKNANRRGTQYGIATGNRTLKVSCEGQVIYEKKIFVSTQEVKQIILP
jgi:FlaG/FlaF family flagellin (archaellin)